MKTTIPTFEIVRPGEAPGATLTRAANALIGRDAHGNPPPGSASYSVFGIAVTAGVFRQIDEAGEACMQAECDVQALTSDPTACRALAQALRDMAAKLDAIAGRNERRGVVGVA